MAEPEVVFAFPNSGLLAPPTPPRQYTLPNLELCYQQASTLWPNVSRTSCANALASHFADGDPTKAVTLIQFYRSAEEGHVTSVCRKNGSYLPLRGAINVHGISCYVDSLLVAMFSRMENFEPLLYKRHYGDSATDQFATWLRLFVNLLRNGERITDDIVAGLMAAAINAGWAVSTPLSQQDAAEFFVFITEKLLMPLLVLRVDIAHAGKEAKEYDHKMIKEQLLYLPVPGADQDSPLLLEECFEIYFSNVINVSRHLSQPTMHRPRASSSSIPDSGTMPPSTPLSTYSAWDFSAQNLDFSRDGHRDSHRNWDKRSSDAHNNLRSNSDQSQQRPSVSGMANTVASWLNLSNSDRASSTRQRSYSILSLTSSPGLRKTHRESFSSSTVVPSLPFHAPKFNNIETPECTTGDDLVDPLDSQEGALISPKATASSRESEYANRSEQLSDRAETRSELTPEATGSLPSYHQLFGSNDDSHAEARVRDMKRSLWTSNNEVMLPAWMFLQLMPFYADNVLNKDELLDNLEADEVARHFRNARPVLGICLKRYYVDENGQPHRNNRRVIIPETIHMPSFVADDSDKQQAFGKFKLVLESAIMHRGSSIHSGHYFTLLSEPINHHVKNNTAYLGVHSEAGKWSSVFNNPALNTSAVTNQSYQDFSRPRSSLPPSPKLGPLGNPFSHGDLNATTPSLGSNWSFPSSSEGFPDRKWYMFDDMQQGGDRVKIVDPAEVFDAETPYMLFYRMVSLEDDEMTASQNQSVGQASTNLQTMSTGLLAPTSSGAASQPDQEWAFSRGPSPELNKEKDKKRRSKFFRRHKEKEKFKEREKEKEKIRDGEREREKDKEGTKDYASKYREEKCSLM